MKTMRLPNTRRAPFLTSALSACVMLGLCASVQADSSAPVNISDPFVKQQTALSVDKIPPMPAPGSYGMDKATGKFTHPVATPFSHESYNLYIYLFGKFFPEQAKALGNEVKELSITEKHALEALKAWIFKQQRTVVKAKLAK